MSVGEWAQILGTTLAIIVGLRQLLSAAMPLLTLLIGDPSAVSVLRDQLNVQNNMVANLIEDRKTQA